MKHLLLSLCTLLLLACSHSDVELSATDLSQPINMGNADARVLGEIPLSDAPELQAAILAIKAREHQLRKEVGDGAADSYIMAIKDYLTLHHPDLAKELL